MSIEILTVGLDEETIEKVAQRIVQLTGGANLWPNGSYSAGGNINTPNTSVTQSNPPASEPRRTQTPPVSSQDSEGWDTPAPTPSPRPDSVPDSTPDSVPDSAPAAPAVRLPRCTHGEMRHVKAGFSKRSGKAYAAFYGCPARQGEQQCQSIQAQEWADRVAAEGRN